MARVGRGPSSPSPIELPRMILERGRGSSRERHFSPRGRGWCGKKENGGRQRGRAVEEKGAPGPTASFQPRLPSAHRRKRDSGWNGRGRRTNFRSGPGEIMDSLEQLPQLEALCERLYNAQDHAERTHAESVLLVFSSSSEYAPQCKAILDNSSSPYAQLLASSSLLKIVTEQGVSKALLLDIRNYVLGYLANRGPNCQVTPSPQNEALETKPRVWCVCACECECVCRVPT